MNMRLASHAPFFATRPPGARLGKNNLEKTRDIAVLLATATGAGLSFFYMDLERKAPLENTLLGLSALALTGIALTTLANDIL